MSDKSWQAEVTGPYPKLWLCYRVHYTESGVDTWEPDAWFRTREKAEKAAKYKIARWRAWQDAKDNKTTVIEQ